MKHRSLIVILLLALVAIAVMPVTAQGNSSSQPVTITLWRHTSDGQAELNTSKAQVDDFNKSQTQWKIDFQQLPQQNYTQAVSAAALAGNLPCVLDFDAPTVPNFAWSGYIQPLTNYITDQMKSELSPAVLGTYKNDIYAVGQFNAAIAIFGRRSILQANNIRIPTVDNPWTLDEFNSALNTLKALPQFDTAIDMYTYYSGEWWTYAFSPILQSFGGDLINRNTYQTADGYLNGKDAVAWGNWFQNLFQSGLADPTPPDDQAFPQGRAALAYIGNWMYPSLQKAWGDDLVIMPPVDFGHGPKVGGGSWQWGISSTCQHPDGAWAFIQYIMQPQKVADMSNATGLIPATSAAAALTQNYAQGGPLNIFVNIANNFTEMRPPTPGYPFLTTTFEKAARDISQGADVQSTLDNAVNSIDQNIKDNNSYGFAAAPTATPASGS